MLPAETNQIVIDLLNKLIRENPSYTWKLRCSFSDGKGRTIMEVGIFGADGLRRHGRIAYQAETAEVLNYNYRDMETTAVSSIVDLLLDISNFEKQYPQSA